MKPDHENAEPSVLVTLDEFAQMARIPLNTARYWRANGHGPKFVRIGRRVMARRSDVEAWINAQFEEAS